MSRIYNYTVNDRVFFDTLMEIIKSGKTESEQDLLETLANGKCNVIPNIPNPPSLSYKSSLVTSSILNNFDKQEIYNRYNDGSIIIDATAYFSIIDWSHNIKIEAQEKLIDLCNKIINPDAGLKITKVEFKPLLIEKTSKSLDINEIINEISKNNLNVILPPDIPEKGKEMSEVYMYLYVVENSIRLFIHKIGRNKLGDDYFHEFHLSKDIKNKINGRKNKAAKNKWLPLRGDSDLFYLDFDDLGNIIQNNWDYFKEYFPDMGWIITKINELANCRHLIAHNSYIDDHGKDVIKTNYKSILKQLGREL